jgi:hypothetical protein
MERLEVVQIRSPARPALRQLALSLNVETKLGQLMEQNVFSKPLLPFHSRGLAHFDRR